MKGLELARGYYEAYGRQMIDEQFPLYASRIAVGLVGEGSECLGYDDALSQDHDFEPGFCLFIEAADERELGFRLERAYAKLPKEYMGYRRQPLSPTGGNRHGVLTVEAFYTKFLGAPTAPDTAERWLYTPPEMLLAASNGSVFRDDGGAFTVVRQVLLAGYPEDIRLKKLAAHAALAAQAGSYNYPRLIARGDAGAAQLAVFEFVKHTISIVYLLNRRYQPFYKWAYRGLQSLPLLGDIGGRLVTLGECGNTPAEASAKEAEISAVTVLLIEAFHAQSITKASGNNLEAHAFSILRAVKDNELRNTPVMSGI